MFKTRAWTISLLSMALLGATASYAAPVLPTVLVNDRPITVSDVQARMALLKALDQSADPLTVQQSLIDEWLIAQEAKQQNIAGDDSRAVAFRQRLLAYLKATEKTLPQIAAQRGFDLATFEAFAQAQPLKNALVVRRFPLQKTPSATEITEAATVWLSQTEVLQKAYANCKLTQPPEQQGTVVVRPIELAPQVADALIKANIGSNVGPFEVGNNRCIMLTVKNRYAPSATLTDDDKNAIEDRLTQSELNLQAEAVLRDLRATALMKRVS